MTWTHIRAAPSMGQEEQWIFRPATAPICSLRRDPDQTWQTRLLCLEGISCSVLWLAGALTVEEAKRASEDELRRMGHEWSGDGKATIKRTAKEKKRWLSPSNRSN